MNRQEKRVIFRSMAELEKEYFPEYFRKKMMPEYPDAEALGIIMAKQTMERVEKQITIRNKIKE